MNDFETVREFKQAQVIKTLEAEVERLRAGLAMQKTAAMKGIELREAEVERLRGELSDMTELAAGIERVKLDAKAHHDQHHNGAEVIRLSRKVERLRAENEHLRARLGDPFEIDRLKKEVERLRATHGKGKCVPADEFEKAKEPVFAEGMRAGCEDLMMEAARLDAEVERLRPLVEGLASIHNSCCQNTMGYEIPGGCSHNRARAALAKEGE